MYRNFDFVCLFACLLFVCLRDIFISLFCLSPPFKRCMFARPYASHANENYPTNIYISLASHLQLCNCISISFTNFAIALTSYLQGSNNHSMLLTSPTLSLAAKRKISSFPKATSQPLITMLTNVAVWQLLPMSVRFCS
jgi:Na+-driven multidrug efflux pump